MASVLRQWWRFPTLLHWPIGWHQGQSRVGQRCTMANLPSIVLAAPTPILIVQCARGPPLQWVVERPRSGLDQRVTCSSRWASSEINLTCASCSPVKRLGNIQPRLKGVIDVDRYTLSILNRNKSFCFSWIHSCRQVTFKQLLNGQAVFKSPRCFKTSRATTSHRCFCNTFRECVLALELE